MDGEVVHGFSNTSISKIVEVSLSRDYDEVQSCSGIIV